VQITAQIGEVDEYEDELDAQVGFYYLRDYEYIDLVEILRDEFFEVGEFNPICGDTCAPKTPQHITITSENKHELNTAEEKVASSPFAALQSLMNK
jgi:uncharacterized metal-binding protein YceD (DUF177 family)